jgi:hypothetical protein
LESVRVVEEAVGSVDDRSYADRMGCDEERDFANRILDQRDAAIRERDESRQVAQTFESLCLAEQARNKVLKARVAELEAAAKLAPDANADGGSNHVAQAASGGEGEPAGWCAEWKQDGKLGSLLYRSHPDAMLDIPSQCNAVPLYRQPPQPRGWLKEEEREALRYASQGLREAGGISNVQAMKQIDALLGRSSPPEVVLESWREHAGQVVSLDDVRAALAAAGVAVKEVGRD